MIQMLLVGVGGFVGAVGRYLLQGLVSWIAPSWFPFGTAAVNVSGSFFMGLFFTLSTERLAVTPEMRTFAAIGVLGAFTTFSTFSYETFKLLEDGSWAMALGNVVGSVVLGLAALWAGVVLARVI